MKTKRYVTPTLKQATDNMKAELGEEAVILSTRVIEKFDSGSMKKFFELVAGYEEEQEELAEIMSGETAEENSIGSPLNFNEKAIRFSEELEKTMRIARPKETPSSENLKDEIQVVIETLQGKEVRKEIVQMVLNYLKKSKDFLTLQNLDDYVLSSLASLITTKNFGLDKKGTGKVISIIGPTGVGKTTCIAKLAAISKIIHNLDIGIISIDTYRLGAIDQLRIFSEISNVDMLVAYEPAEMPKLVEKLKNKDLIFIDTTGRSQRNKNELRKMNEFFSGITIDETYLALSLTSSAKTMADAAEKFSLFNYDSFIFTKIDEAVTHGNIVNLTVNYQKPVIYLTNGQIIPDDIISADPEYMANLIYKGTNEI